MMVDFTKVMQDVKCQKYVACVSILVPGICHAGTWSVWVAFKPGRTGTEIMALLQLGSGFRF